MVFIARNTSEAKRVEQLLNDRGIDYTMSLEPFFSSGLAFVFGGRHPLGAFFWVLSGQAFFARTLLKDHGFRAGIVVDDIG